MDEFKSDRFEIDSLIGEGNFGQVFKANDKTNGAKVAIKIEKFCKVSQISTEIEVLQALSGEKGFPKLIESGVCSDKKYVVMSLLGQNLQKKMILMRKMINLETVLEIGLQCLLRIKTLHEKFYIHRDLKPQQFLIDNDMQVSLIDFGLSKKYLNSKLMIHIPYTDNRPFVGTINYASLNTHLGIQQSRRDDLESFCYVLSYLIKGKLPWISNKKKFNEKEIKKLKTSLVPSMLFSSQHLNQFFVYVKNLQFDKCPDYRYLIDLINKVLTEEKIGSIYGVSADNSSLAACSKASTKSKDRRKKRKYKRSNFCRSLEDICISLEDNSKTEVCEQMPEIKNRVILRETVLKVIESPLSEKYNCLIY